MIRFFLYCPYKLSRNAYSCRYTHKTSPAQPTNIRKLNTAFRWLSCRMKNTNKITPTILNNANNTDSMIFNFLLIFASPDFSRILCATECNASLCRDNGACSVLKSISIAQDYVIYFPFSIFPSFLWFFYNFGNVLFLILSIKSIISALLLVLM